MFPGELLVIDAIDHGEIGAVGAGADTSTRLAPAARCAAALSRGRKAGAFQGDVDVQLPVGQLGRIPDGADLDAMARRRS